MGVLVPSTALEIDCIKLAELDAPSRPNFESPGVNVSHAILAFRRFHSRRMTDLARRLSAPAGLRMCDSVVVEDLVVCDIAVSGLIPIV